ncbi:MAG: hypothetical protein IPN42_14985 [Methylococcaceae bacterium]|nr:hypothetical protein [Methylococcaceae bacterium]
MKLILLITILLSSFIINAQDGELDKKPIKLDLKPDFNDELKYQDQIATDRLIPKTNNQEERKSIFDSSDRPTHQFTMGVAAGNTVIQDGIQPITNKPLKAKMNTVFEK